MKCLNKVLTIIGCITAIVAVVAAAFAVFSYFDKKKQDAELEEYLEGAIQEAYAHKRQGRPVFRPDGLSVFRRLHGLTRRPAQSAPAVRRPKKGVLRTLSRRIPLPFHDLSPGRANRAAR